MYIDLNVTCYVMLSQVNWMYRYIVADKGLHVYVHCLSRSSVSKIRLKVLRRNSEDVQQLYNSELQTDGALTLNTCVNLRC